MISHLTITYMMNWFAPQFNWSCSLLICVVARFNDKNIIWRKLSNFVLYIVTTLNFGWWHITKSTKRCVVSRLGKHMSKNAWKIFLKKRVTYIDQKSGVGADRSKRGIVVASIVTIEKKSGKHKRTYKEYEALSENMSSWMHVCFCWKQNLI